MTSSGVAARLFLGVADGVFQQLAIQLVTDSRDMAALLRAEDVAGAANLQVAQGDLEARAEFGELLDRLEPLGGDWVDGAVAVEQQVGVGAVLESADAAAQLMQVGQAIVVGLVDEDACWRWGCRGRSR